VVTRLGAVAAVLLASLVSGATAAAPDPVEEIREEALHATRALELVRSLTMEVGPRSAGSDGDRRAVAWGVERLAASGFDRVWTEPVTVPHWVRGQASAAIVAPFPQSLVVTALGGSAGTPEAGLEAEVVRFETVDDLEAAPADAVRGKIVFLDGRMERRRDGSGYAETVPNRGRGPAVGSEKGALAVVIRSVGTGTHRFPHTGGTRFAEGVRRIPAAALAIPDADILAHQLEMGKPVRLRLRLTSRFLADAESANVLAEIQGSERPGEIVLLACHLDSWDLGTGAIDDAAGCATVVEAARIAGRHRPRRTIRVLLAANEEHGLSGARAYAAAHEEEIAGHVLAFEADFGAGAVWAYGSAVNPAAKGFLAASQAALAPLGIEYAGNEARGGADLIPLRQASVPLADLAQDGTYYFDYHHTADDTFDKVDPEALAQNVAAHAVLAWIAAHTDDELRPAPPREDG
jgi:Zn-dependent M28 family amino/carboxypeptidase